MFNLFEASSIEKDDEVKGKTKIAEFLDEFW